MNDQPAYFPTVATTTRVEQTSPHFVTITFQGEDLTRCATTLLDQRIKILLGDPAVLHDLAKAPDWMGPWRDLPDDQRPAMRTYTPWAVRPEQGEVDVVFVAHGETGPASRFALHAQTGDQIGLVLPNAHSPLAAEVGVAWHPGGARDVLLVGDETAAPAIANVVTQLPRDVVGQAIIEVPDAADQLTVEPPPGLEVTWAARREHAPTGFAAAGHVARWCEARGMKRVTQLPFTSDDDDPGDLLWDEAAAEAHEWFGWFAGEATWIAQLRRLFTKELGVAKKDLSLMGYWRRGAVLG